MNTAITSIIITLISLILILLILCIFIFSNLIWVTPISVPSFITKLIEKAIVGSGVPDQYPSDAHKAEKVLETLPFEEITLNSSDGARLKGHILCPNESNGCLILACHGARSHAFGEFCFMIPYFYKNGYTMVLPEHRGCGNSDGKFMGYGTHESKDTFLWLDYAQKRFHNYDVFLLGVSMGAATVLMMSNNLKNTSVRGVIADCSYTSAWDEFAYQLKTSFHLPAFPILYICDFYCRCVANYSFKEASPYESVKNAEKPILFIHGRADDYVPFYMQKKLYDACASPKEYLVVDDAVHARSYYTNPSLYNKTVTDFISKNRKANKGE